MTTASPAAARSRADDGSTEAAAPGRRFRVRSWGDVGHHERIVIEPTFEAAALSYAEHVPPEDPAKPGVRVLVHDIESGHEHSFLIHIDPD